MQRDKFVKRAQEIGELESREEAEKAIRATCESLEQRLAGNKPSNLAVQLLEDIAAPLQDEGGQENFALAEFYRRSADKDGAEKIQAISHVRAVALVV